MRSESSLGARVILLVLSCFGSFIYFNMSDGVCLHVCISLFSKVHNALRLICIFLVEFDIALLTIILPPNHPGGMPFI